jgi:predicted TPR repeat methyltransferase
VPPRSYFQQARPELVAQLPPGRLGRLLDVGCGAGGVGKVLRNRVEFLAGIELDPEAAAAARMVYDQVVTGRAEELVSALAGPFHTILAYDLLEHLAEPVALLQRLRTVASDGALLHVSVPNARHWSLVRDLVFRLAARLTGGRSAEFLVYQWSALSRNAPAGSPSPAGAVDPAAGRALPRT